MEKEGMDQDRTMDGDKFEEIMLPGFRFHPTDEELVGFYLKRKIQQRPLSIELIKQLDIYKYDPWDLPKLASTGDKEWYFYCPRDRKYRNSTRPNRVTGAGFWKATGTDRPIYSSEGTKCIGLKKSLVFYEGRAAKGAKTDWMMHEFRLPSLTDSTPPKRFFDKTIPANDAWAICRIFKKTNSTAQRTAQAHSLVSPLPTTPSYDHNPQMFSSDNMSMRSKTSSLFPFSSNLSDMQQSSVTNIFPFDHLANFRKSRTHETDGKPSHLPVPNELLTANYFGFPSINDTTEPMKSTVDASSVLLNMSSSVLGVFGTKAEDQSIHLDTLNGQHNIFLSPNLPIEMQEQVGNEEANGFLKYPNMSISHTSDGQWDAVRSFNGYPFGLPSSIGDAWKANLVWDSPSCPSEVSSSLSTTKCYT